MTKSTAPAPIAPSVVKQNKAMQAQQHVEEKAAEEHCAETFALVEQKLGGTYSEVKWMRQTATTVKMLKDSREAGGLAWVTCAQALDRCELFTVFTYP